MIRETMNALAACVVSFVLCAVAYPAAVWGLGQLAFPRQAEGSLIFGRDRSVIGSELIAQPFASDRYFFPRPSAVDYKADATGGSNLGTKNPDLRKKVAERAEALKATPGNPAPVDLVSASGGGMDPHVTAEAAYYQAPRVAAARRVTVGQIRGLIGRHVERSGAVIGAPARVNVLRLNLALDVEVPAPAPATADEAKVSTVTPPVAPAADDLGSLRTSVVELAAGLGRINGRIEEFRRAESARQETVAEVKAIEERLTRLAAAARVFPATRDSASGLESRVDAAGESVGRLRDEVRSVRESLKREKSPPPGTKPGPPGV